MESTRKTRDLLAISPIDGCLGEEILHISGLLPIRTMVKAFVRVVDYGTYRLRKQHCENYRRKPMEIYHLKKQVDGLHPAFDPFDGAKYGRLLSFF